jgi:hypothetical protein
MLHQQEERVGAFRSTAVELKSHFVGPVLDSNVPFRGLVLVKPCKPELPQKKRPQSVAPIFSPAEMRHNFAIGPLDEGAHSERRHLYYCTRCKWAFRVDDRWTAVTVTPLDANGSPIQSSEVAQRLATFALGPCPVFSRLTRGPRLTQEVTPLETFRRRFAALILSGRRAWKVRVWRWRQSKFTSSDQNRRSASK